MALVAAGVIPQNSQSPLSADYWAQDPGNDLYAAFAAGLTLIPARPCAPGPSAFLPSLPYAAAQAAVSQTAAPLSTSALLPAALEQQGQEGATGSASQFEDAAEVAGATQSSRAGHRRAVSSRRSYSAPLNDRMAGTPWGGVSVRPTGTCGNGQKLSLGVKMTLLVGAVAIGYALLEGR